MDPALEDRICDVYDLYVEVQFCNIYAVYGEGMKVFDTSILFLLSTLGLTFAGL